MSSTQSQSKRHRSWRRGLLWAGGVMIFGLAVLLGSAAQISGTPGGAIINNLIQAISSSQFRLFLVVGVASLVLLAVAAGFLGFRAALRKNRPGPEAGTVLIEFAMLFPILVMLSLTLLQSSLLMGGYLCVNYASFCAARAAIVFIPQRIGAEEPNVLADLSNANNSPKLQRIRQAAIWAVMPTGDPGWEGSTSSYEDELVDGLEAVYNNYGETPPKWASGYLRPKLAYAEDNTTVIVQPPTGDDPDTFGPHEDIHITVQHNLYLSVPYGAQIFAFLDEEAAVDLGDGKKALRINVKCTLTNEGVSDEIESETFPDDS